MLSARAYSFRQQSRLAISLSWIGGYTNIIALLVCHNFVSHMTGNTTLLGENIAERDWAAIAFLGWVILSFFIGAAASGFMTEGARRRGIRRKYILPIAAQALLLCLFTVAIAYNGPTLLKLQDDSHKNAPLALFWVTSLAATAMGLQNATITRISGAVVRTTHLTGVVTDLGLEGAQYAMWVWDKLRGRGWPRGLRLIRLSRRHPSALRLLLLASIFCSFLFGTVAGTLAFTHWHHLAMLLPVAFLMWIILVDATHPISDVRELDVIGDPELKGFGIMQEMLPRELGIYRMATHRHSNRAPDFELWVEHLPKHWRVIILAITPWMRIDRNAAMDLSAAISKLQAGDKRLILCGISTWQYKLLDRYGVLEKIRPENLCGDLEFAVARAIELLRE